MNKNEFIKELRKIIPELPELLKSVEISAGIDMAVTVKCEFYVSCKLETTTLEIEDADQPNSSN